MIGVDQPLVLLVISASVGGMMMCLYSFMLLVLNRKGLPDAIKVRSFDEYRARLLENFVILERSERHNKIARELDAKAQRLQGRVSRIAGDSGLLHEVPDLVEYPSVVAGTFAIEFLELPAEVLTTTLIHHQHYFPVEGEDGKLKNAFLAVINTEPDNERTISIRWSAASCRLPAALSATARSKRA